MSLQQTVLIESLHEELLPLLTNMARQAARSLGIDYEDILAEFNLQLVETVHHYQGKPREELLKLVVRSCKNKAYDLKRMHFGTHRCAEYVMLSLDADQDDSDDVYINPIEPSTIDCYMIDMLDGLSADAITLLHEILNPSPRALFHYALQECRKIATAKKGLEVYRISPIVVCRAIGWTRERTEIAWNELLSCSSIN